MTSSITVEEVRQKVRKLEEDVRRLCDAFYAETEVEVSEIELERIYSGDGRYVFYIVRAETRISGRTE